METIKKICKVIIGVIMVAMGISAIIFPGEAFENLAVLWAVLFLIGGIAGIVSFFAVGKGIPGRGMLLLLGILQTLLGITLVSNGAFLPQLVALDLCQIWIIFSGIEFFVGAFEEKDAGMSGWWLTLILGILLLIIGMSAGSSIIFSVVSVATMVGTGLILSGVAFVVNALSKSKAKATAKK